MKVISCVGAKGGTGKSSISLLLAWELAQEGNGNVSLLDADVQGTCVSAKNFNPEIPFDVYSVGDRAQLWTKGKQLSDDGCDYLIIDGNPRSINEDPDLIQIIAKLSDLNLIITRPSPRDLKAQIKYVDMVKFATTGETRILWNFYQKNTGAHKEGVPEGERLLGLKSVDAKIGHRVCYQDVGYTEGYIGNLGNPQATKEISILSREVKGLVNGKK